MRHSYCAFLENTLFLEPNMVSVHAGNSQVNVLLYK